MENTREKNKRSDGRKKTYFDRENKKKAVRTEKTKSVAPEKGKQKKIEHYITSLETASLSSHYKSISII